MATVLAVSLYTDSCFNLSTTAIFFCPQGGCLGGVQLYLNHCENHENTLGAHFTEVLVTTPLKPPGSKFEFSFVALIHFLQKKWGEADKISRKFILYDHVCNSRDHSVLRSIDITRRNLMLITLRA